MPCDSLLLAPHIRSCRTCLCSGHQSPRLHSCSFCGAAGQDETAERYKTELLAQGVEPYLVHPPTTTAHEPSAVSVCLITPDGQRTMRTCLGASATLSAASLPADRLASCSVLHCEGYALFKPDVLKRAIAEAKAAGAQVSLDLASFEVVRACLGTLREVLETGGVDIVFCNEDEMSEVHHLGAPLDVLRELGAHMWRVQSVLVAWSFRGASCHGFRLGCRCAATEGGAAPESSSGDAAHMSEAERILLQHCSLVVSTLGRRGARAAARNGRTTQVPACRVPVVDTVGAGDYFCGAFLAAHVQGASLSKAVGAGCAAGAQIVQCAGAHLTDAAWKELRAKFAEILASESPVQSPVQ